MKNGRKPKNDFSVREALLTNDWSDLTNAEIAEVLGVSVHYIHSEKYRIKRETGIVIPCIDGRSQRYADDGI